MLWPQTSLRTVVFSSLIAMVIFPSLAFGSTDFVLPPGRATSPYSIVVGPDSNLWFAEVSGEKIGRITTGGVITEFPITGAQALTGITSGPDGNLWFTDQLAGKVGHISTSGTGVTQFALPAGSFPQGITTGPDGNLWFVEQKQSGFFAIGKMTVAGVLTEYPTTVEYAHGPAAGNSE
jgi:virginiamycin B lyase